MDKFQVSFVVEGKDRYDVQKEWNDKIGQHVSVDDYKEPTNYQVYAEDLADEIIADYNIEIMEIIKTGESDKKDVDDIWSDIYDASTPDLHMVASEKADGIFIYNDTKSLVEAMQCLDQLSDHDVARDNGLVEGVDEYWSVINVSATYALEGAIMEALEDKIRESIELRLQATEAQSHD
jgi:hypothetical protein